ncbi:hypothetical protein Tco_0759165 [Tanacetum coccineum]
MAPKRTTRSTQVIPTPNGTTTTTVTKAQLQALIDRGVAAAMAEAEASRVRNGYDSNGSGPRPAQAVRECSYSEFRKCKPLDFKGTEGDVRLSRWFEKMEYVFSISNYTASCQVKFTTCTLKDDALTWWNAHVKTTTPEAAHAMPWATLKKMMTDKYCRGDVLEEEDKLKKYIGGYADMILKKRKESMMIFPRTIKTNNSRIRGRTQARPTLQAIVTGNHMTGLNLYVPSVITIMKVLVHQGAVTAKRAPAKVYVVGNAGANPNNVIAELGSFDAIIGMDWLAKYQAVIVCAEKIKYMQKRFPIFLAHVTAKEVEDKSEKKRLEDVPMVRDFPEHEHRQRLYKTQFLTLGSSGLVSQEEGWIIPDVH